MARQSNQYLRETYWRATNKKQDPHNQNFRDWRYPNENTARDRGIAHPARFSYKLYDIMADALRREFGEEEDFLALDPFAGIGGIHNLAYHIPNIMSVGVEIEKEWAECHPNTITGDSRFLDKMFEPDTFDAIVTSPTYANRLADNFTPKDDSTRLSYQLSLGRKLTEGTTANKQWGAEYRDLHFNIWKQCWHVLRPNGIFVLNIKDHVRNHKIVPVTDFHIEALTRIGFRMEAHEYVPLNGYRYGKNFKSRMKYESVITFRKPLASLSVDDLPNLP